MKAFFWLIAIIGLAVFAVKWFSEKDAQVRAKDSIVATSTPAEPAPAAKATPVFRSPLDAPPARTSSNLYKHQPPNRATAEKAAQQSSNPLNRPAYK